MYITIVYLDTNFPAYKLLHSFSHIILSSYHPWNSHDVVLPKSKRTLENDIGKLGYMGLVATTSGF